MEKFILEFDFMLFCGIIGIRKSYFSSAKISLVASN